MNGLIHLSGRLILQRKVCLTSIGSADVCWKGATKLKRKVDLTQGNILKGFFLFAFPLFLGSLFQLLYGTVDLLFVGNFLGKTDAAAVGASSILVTCLVGLLTGISVGAGVVLAQLWGGQKLKEADICIENTIFLGAAGGILLTGLGLLFAEPALLFLHTPESIMSRALLYIRIYLFSVTAMILYNMSAALLRAMGDSKTPFLVLATGGILNVGMDAWFIAVMKSGIAGAATATLISQSFTAAVLIIRIFRQNHLLKKHWNISREMIFRILGVGVPLGIQSMILTVSNLFVQYYINGFGENTIAAFTVYFKVENLIYLPVMAFGQAMVTFTGQNIGAGNMDRIRKGAVICNIFAIAVTMGISAMVLCFGRQVLQVFCGEEAVIEEGLKIIRITFPFYFMYAILEVTGGIIRGNKKTMQSMAIVVIDLCVVRVLLLNIFAEYFHSIQAVAVVYPVTWTLAAGSFVLYYLFQRNFADKKNISYNGLEKKYRNKI